MGMKERIERDLTGLMQVPGLSGHEDRVRRFLAARLAEMNIQTSTDRLGNLLASFAGTGPSVMLFTHMDQLGFIVRAIEPDGFLRIERLGGVPERALASQAVLVCVGKGADASKHDVPRTNVPRTDVPGIIANKSHHATGADEKYRVVPYKEHYVDTGLASARDVAKAGIKIGAPVVYAPNVVELAGDRIAGTSVDDRAGCAVLLEVARALGERKNGPPVHLVFSTLEEFNLRGALPMAQKLLPDIAIQIDLALAADTPDMAGHGEVRLGGGPAISLYSFHGRGTLNGVIPHPAMVQLFENTAMAEDIPLQRGATTGVLTDLSYVQLVGEGVAAIDMGFPMRNSHSSLEVCDLGDLGALSRLLIAALARIDPEFSLSRDEYT